MLLYVYIIPLGRRYFYGVPLRRIGSSPYIASQYAIPRNPCRSFRLVPLSRWAESQSVVPAVGIFACPRTVSLLLRSGRCDVPRIASVKVLSEEDLLKAHIGPSVSKARNNAHLHDNPSISISLFEVSTPYSPITPPFEAPTLQSHRCTLSILPAGVHTSLDLRERRTHFHD